MSSDFILGVAVGMIMTNLAILADFLLGWGLFKRK